MTELEKAWEEAYNIEAVPKHIGRMVCIGRREYGDRLYIFYRDAAGGYWYRVQIKTAAGYVSEREAIFGRRKGK